MDLSALKMSQRFTGLSKNTYRLRRPASPWHKHAWIAQSKIDGRLVFFKSPLRPESDDQAQATRQLDNEMTLLCGPVSGVEGVRQVIDLVDLQDDSAVNKARAVVLEYLENDLHKFHLTDKKAFALSQIKICARQLTAGICKVHKKKIIHTDLKLENIGFSMPEKKLFWRASSEPLFKILDIGVAASTPEDRQRLITNPYWRSPESRLGLHWGPSTDMWSLGAIIGSLLMEPGAKLLRRVGDTRNFPPENHDLESIRALWTLVEFPSTLVNRVSPEMQREISQFEPVLTPTGQPMTLSLVGEAFDAVKGGWDFITTAMEPDPEKRPTAEQLLQHHWLRQA